MNSTNEPSAPPRTYLDTPCPACTRLTVVSESVDSSCGGYTDYRMTCDHCGHVYWIDGADA